MSETLFDVTFSGQLAPGASVEVARARLRNLFHLDDERAALLFSGRRVVLKRAVDEQTARRLLAAFLAVGALAEMEPLEALETIFAAPPPPDSESPPGPTAAADSAPVAAAAFDAGLTPDPLAEPTAALDADQRADRLAAPTPSAGLALAPPGSPLDEIDERVPIPFPDISGLQLVGGADWSLADCDRPPTPQSIPHTMDLALEPLPEPRWPPLDVD